jgi:hypothetical protein
MDWAFFNAMLADPATAGLIFVCGIGIVAAALYYGATAGNLAGPAPMFPPARTVDMDLIEVQTQRALHAAGQTACTPGPKQPGCNPPCRLAACDAGQGCARRRAGGKVLQMERLTAAEVEMVRECARAAALADHTRRAKDRPNPMPRNTRSAGVWATEYAHQRHALAEFEQAA